MSLSDKQVWGPIVMPSGIGCPLMQSAAAAAAAAAACVQCSTVPTRSAIVYFRNPLEAQESFTLFPLVVIPPVLWQPLQGVGLGWFCRCTFRDRLGILERQGSSAVMPDVFAVMQGLAVWLQNQSSHCFQVRHLACIVVTVLVTLATLLCMTATSDTSCRVLNS